MRTFEEITDAVIRHMETGTLESGERVGSNPVTSYTDPALFDQEMARVVRRRPFPLSASDRIPEKGDLIAEEICGVPALTVRDEEGRARVYLNVCRHRGARLVSETVGRDCSKLVCPSHGWSYRLNGELSDVPEAKHCFATDSMKGFGLRELPSREYAGMIWAILDPSADSSEIDHALSHLKADSAELGFIPSFALPERGFSCSFNWKLGVEAFLEVYHFPYAHAPFLSELEFPNLSLMDPSRENCRIAVPLEKPARNQPILQWAQVMYFIFPSSFLLFYDDHVALISLVPMAIDRTRLRYIPLVPTREGLSDQQIRERVEFLEVIIGQDIAILEGVQKGLASQANSRFTFTRLEHALSKFHQDLSVR